SGIVENGLESGQVAFDPAGIDGAPVVDAIVAGVVALAVVLDEAAIDVQVAECSQGVLRGAARHAGRGHQRGDAAGRAAVDQPGDVESPIETAFGLADGHCSGPRAGSGAPAPAPRSEEPSCRA